MIKSIKLFWVRLWFSIKYPVNYTNNLVWIEAFNKHLKNIKEIQK